MSAVTYVGKVNARYPSQEINSYLSTDVFSTPCAVSRASSQSQPFPSNIEPAQK